MFLLNEDNHGVIAIVTDTAKIIEWLWKEKWMDAYTEGMDDGKEITVAEWAGMTPEEVQDNLPTLQTLFEINDFNDLEVFGFYLHTVDVIE